jgi:hypothetical protein
MAVLITGVTIATDTPGPDETRRLRRGPFQRVARLRLSEYRFYHLPS